MAGLSRGGKRIGVLLGLTVAVGYVTQTLAVVQLATVAVLCAVVAVVPKGIGLPPVARVWGALALTALAGPPSDSSCSPGPRPTSHPPEPRWS